ncbi:hypothetical protein QEH59_10010 [Coraliomargarita sp. SDUM461004]|uniref:DUF3108 domain-containing protein n=1 Tax=Thalassobacterium sedimentorum TaxID=3041258 RepID=A0ABU1AIZ0_9BACT|nr:hypothetical protein [Coraliomargarita sp. SDUM461004]MDQ8194760.1 hypothetical protein [Coraliomargarita sp. SDUM461004]
MIYLRSLCLFLFSLLLVEQAHAQSTPELSNIKFRILAWNTTVGEVYIHSAGSYELLQAMPNQVSHEFSYTGPAPLQLYRKAIGPEGVMNYQPYATLKIHPNHSRYLLVLYADAKETDLRKGFLYPYDYTRSNTSPLVLYNMTDFAVKAQLGEEIIELASTRNVAVDPDDLDESSNNYALRCKLASNEGGQWRLIYNDYIHIPNRARVFFFFKQKQQGNSKRIQIETKKIVDYRLSEATRKASSENFDVKEKVEIKPY